MEVISLESNRISEFVSYCKKYRLEHDPSFLSDEDLEEFKLDENNPTYILLNENNEIIGAASLIKTRELVASHKARFRILHSIHTTLEAYYLMLEAILPHTMGIDNIYMFIPNDKKAVGEILENLEFKIQRYSWILKKPLDEAIRPVFSEGYQLRPFRFGHDEGTWCNILNTCFSHLAGHVDSTPERIVENKDSDYYLRNGMMMLYNGSEPVGIVRVTRDDEDENDAYLDQLAVLPEYQGKGFGRQLLRSGVDFANEQGLHNIWLSVNAENSKAAELYLSEGFEKDYVAICYNRKL